MTPSEKIKLIKKIAAELSNEEYGIIDLTLNQFKIPVIERFSGSKQEYVTQQIQDSDDETLMDLATHLEIFSSKTDREIEPDFWEEGYYKLFISHLASDKARAKSLKNELEYYAITSFVAHTDIEPTKEWQDEIELGLRTCNALTALMVENFQNSNWTDQEIGFALGRDLLIIPVRIGKDPYGFIGKYQAITFKSIEKLAEAIFKSLISNKKTSKELAYAVMYKFENSDSFHDAKKNLELVQKIQYWDKNLIKRLKFAPSKNSQIRESFGVPDKIEYMLKTIKPVI